MVHRETADVIVGSDGVPRCSWAGEAGSGLARYHDDVWGIRTFLANDATIIRNRGKIRATVDNAPA